MQRLISESAGTSKVRALFDRCVSSAALDIKYSRTAKGEKIYVNYRRYSYKVRN